MEEDSIFIFYLSSRNKFHTHSFLKEIHSTLISSPVKEGTPEVPDRSGIESDAAAGPAAVVATSPTGAVTGRGGNRRKGGV